FPSTSHVRPDFIASMGSTEKIFWPTFLKSSGNLVKTYIVVRPEASVENLAADLTSIYTTRYGKDNRVTLSLMPLTDIHLKSTVEKDFSINNDIRYVQLLGIIGLIIILISLINYTNLTAARSLTRSKEVGIRQTLGGFRSMIVIQFLCESFLFVLLGLVFSMVLSEMLFPAINRMTSIHLSFSLLESTHWIMIAAAVVLLAITGGVYPAWIVARFKIVHTLKGRVEHVRGSWLRKGLVISQFVSGVILIVATSVIWHQMQFIREARLGFTKEEVAIVRLMDPSVASNLPALKQRWLNIPGVQSVALANAMPGKTHAGDYISHRGTDEDLAVAVNWIDEAFVPTMDLSIIAGRNISPAHPTDNDGSVLINEATARELGYPDPEKAIGTLIALQGTDGGKQRTVVGVVNDFHYESFR
ncbi:MAG TPA: ABC transporter permease, partial [bacterium]|nr:ABC transporter permease [bacterium]